MSTQEKQNLKTKMGESRYCLPHPSPHLTKIQLEDEVSGLGAPGVPLEV